MNGQGKKKDEVTSFTVDSDRSGLHDMPSVTKLLNRKTLSKSGTLSTIPQPPATPPAAPPPFKGKPFSAPEAPSTDFGITLEAPPDSVPASSPTSLTLTAPDLHEAPAPEAPVALAASDLAIELSVDAPTQTTSTKPIPIPALKVQPAQRRVTKETIPPLSAWGPEKLPPANAALAKALTALLASKTLHHALYLAIAPAPAGSPVPVFNATSALQAASKEVVWTGMCWDPRVVPEMWNYFLKAGFVEVSPPGTLTNQKSNRNVIRAAFGIQQDEWMTLVRIGPADGCQGVLALVSKRSITTELSASVPQTTKVA